jgi:hypothetical protein
MISLLSRTEWSIKCHKQQRHSIKEKGHNNRSPIHSNDISINKIDQIVYDKINTPKTTKSTQKKQKKNLTKQIEININLKNKLYIIGTTNQHFT